MAHTVCPWGSLRQTPFFGLPSVSLSCPQPSAPPEPKTRLINRGGHLLSRRLFAFACHYRNDCTSSAIHNAIRSSSRSAPTFEFAEQLGCNWRLAKSEVGHSPWSYQPTPKLQRPKNERDNWGPLWAAMKLSWPETNQQQRYETMHVKTCSSM